MTRVALVTGAARGIGRGIALRLAADGYDVAVNDIPGSQTLLNVVKEIESMGRRSLAAFADVSQDDQVQSMIDEVVKALGSLDIMIANAGVLKVGGLLNTSADDLDRALAINVRGVFLCYKYAARQMIAQGRGGRIIGASSLAGKQASAALIAYSASKFAVRGMTQAAAGELGEHGITVNAYAPGIIPTDMAETLHEGFVKQGWQRATNQNSNPVGRLGTVDEVTAVVSFLASEGSSFVTGQSISVNGGAYFD